MQHEVTLPADAERVLARLGGLRQLDAPTHGGHVLSYVYDSGLAELDELAARAMRAVQPLNGLDPTTFRSIAVMERELTGFARTALHGDPASGTAEPVVGSVTAGGTESCLLAVLAARQRWRAAGGTGTPRLVAPVTAHAAFHKAAALFDLALDPVPVDPVTGRIEAPRLLQRLGPDVALAVVSAPAYPYGVLDPIVEVAAGCAAQRIPCHVDACFGGWILPWWRDADDRAPPPWDFRVPGVTSISVDAHKYGYAPKGVSVLLYRGRDLHRAQFFATTRWPGYPVVNPTLLGSRSAAPLAAAWAITAWLGAAGFRRLAEKCMAASRALRRAIDGIEGLRVIGQPTGPVLAVAADPAVAVARRVDPHRWADAARGLGWVLQQQPGFVQPDGTRLPRSAHLTLTPVSADVADELGAALVAAADTVRGRTPWDAAAMLGPLRGRLADSAGAAPPDSAQAGALLGELGVDVLHGDPALPGEMAPLLAVLEALPHPLVERLLVELLARVAEPAPTPTAPIGRSDP